jgi:signal transduction histidine kinase
MIEQIDAGGQAILNLLNAVLDYSKIEAGKITLQFQPTDVGALLGSVTSFFQLEAQQANTALSLSIEGVPATLLVDNTRLRQIVTNLVANAVKHSPGATVQLKAGYDTGDLLIEVVDTGHGVDEEMQEHLFFPREQRASENSGAGLGLAISRGLVSLMGGEIGFRVTPGGGATFWFRIPASPVAAELG